jgi:hypothetical protein
MSSDGQRDPLPLDAGGSVGEVRLGARKRRLWHPVVHFADLPVHSSGQGRSVPLRRSRVLRSAGISPRGAWIDHANNRAVRGVQRLLAPAFVRFGADHVRREPLEQLQAEGFSIESLNVRLRSRPATLRFVPPACEGQPWAGVAARLLGAAAPASAPATDNERNRGSHGVRRAVGRGIV